MARFVPLRDEADFDVFVVVDTANANKVERDEAGNPLVYTHKADAQWYAEQRNGLRTPAEIREGR